MAGGGVGVVVNVSTLAHTKIVLHAAANPCQVIHGILVGNMDNEKKSSLLRIVDAFPVCHSSPTKTILNMSFRLVDSHLQQQSSSNTNVIVGWYTANERMDDNMEPNQASLRIMTTIHNVVTTVEPVILCLNNLKLTTYMSDEAVADSSSTSSSNCLHGYTWDGKERILVMVDDQGEKIAAAALRAHCDYATSNDSSLPIYDFENHLESGCSRIKETDWLVNHTVVNFVDKLKKPL